MDAALRASAHEPCVDGVRRQRIADGLLADALGHARRAEGCVYFARGYLGQYIVVVPSARLVVVRMGISRTRGGGIHGVGELVESVIGAIRDEDQNARRTARR